MFRYVNTVDSFSTLKHNGRKQYSGPGALHLTPTQRRSRTIVLRLSCLLCIVHSQRLGPQPLLLCQEQVIRLDMLQALISNNQNHHQRFPTRHFRGILCYYGMIVIKHWMRPFWRCLQWAVVSNTCACYLQMDFCGAIQGLWTPDQTLMLTDWTMEAPSQKNITRQWCCGRRLTPLEKISLNITFLLSVPFYTCGAQTLPQKTFFII